MNSRWRPRWPPLHINDHDQVACQFTSTGIFSILINLDSDNGYCDVVAFIGCGLLLGCNAVLLGVCILVHRCGLFACVLRTTSWTLVNLVSLNRLSVG